MKNSRLELLYEGMIAGLIGYVTTIAIFFFANLIAGRSPFHTAAMLGGALFYGLEDPSQVVISPGVVLAYNGFHMVVFLVIGFVAAWIAAESERGPEFWYIGLTLFIFVLFHFYGFLLMLSEPFREAISPWLSFGATFVASAGMIAYLLVVRPKLWVEVRDFREDEVARPVKP
jgi:hypothetical protein